MKPPSLLFAFSLLLFTSAASAAAPTVELPFAPGDTLAYSHDGCERVKIDLDDQTSPVTLELGRDGRYAFYSNGVITATLDVSGLGTTVTEPNWASKAVVFTLDTQEVRTFEVKTDLASTNLTYSGTGWGEPGAGTSATIRCRNGEGDETTLAGGLTGDGETAWTPAANGSYRLSHTSGDAVETATVSVANLVTITVGDLAAKHLTAKVVWNGTETPVTGQSFSLPKGGKNAKLVLTADHEFVLPSAHASEIGLDDHLAAGEPVSIAADIPAAVPYGVRLVGITNRYPWNGKIDVVASVAGLDAAKYYQLAMALTLGGVTKRVCRELGAGKEATYTYTVDCAALFGTNAVGEVRVKLSLEQYAAERMVGVASVAKAEELMSGKYLIINLETGSFMDTTLDDYLAFRPGAWSLAANAAEITVEVDEGQTFAYAIDGGDLVLTEEVGLARVTFAANRNATYSFYGVAENGTPTLIKSVEVTDAGGETVSESDEGAVAVDTRATKEIDGLTWAGAVNLTYSGGGWGEAVSESAAIAVAFEGGTEQPFAKGLTGAGTVQWNPKIGGTYVFTHTAGNKTETATFNAVRIPGGEDNPWKIGAGDAAAVTAYVKDGYLYLAGAGEVMEFVGDAPWAGLGELLVGIGPLFRAITVPVSVMATLPISVEVVGWEPSGAISPAEFDRIEVVDGKAHLGVSVYTNGVLEVERVGVGVGEGEGGGGGVGEGGGGGVGEGEGGGEGGGGEWRRVKIGDAQVEDDGTVTLTVPAPAETGFMILKSKGT